MADHALLTDRAARRAGADEALVVAYLLHDIGHFLEGPDEEFGSHDHGTAGADFLAERFPPQVSEPVRLHIDAKRYLCAIERDCTGPCRRPLAMASPNRAGSCLRRKPRHSRAGPTPRRRSDYAAGKTRVARQSAAPSPSSPSSSTHSSTSSVRAPAGSPGTVPAGSGPSTLLEAIL